MTGTGSAPFGRDVDDRLDDLEATAQERYRVDIPLLDRVDGEWRWVNPPAAVYDESLTEAEAAKIRAGYEDAPLKVYLAATETHRIDPDTYEVESVTPIDGAAHDGGGAE